MSNKRWQQSFLYVGSWTTQCGLSSTVLRQRGFIPHSRIFNRQEMYSAQFRIHDTAPWWKTTLFNAGFPLVIELNGTERLQKSTKRFWDTICLVDEAPGEWLAIRVDRRKPYQSVVFAFRDEVTAMYARLALED